MKRVIYLLLILVLVSCSKEGGGNGSEGKFVSNSSVEVASSLKSNMVIQQNSVFKIQGKGTPGEPIRVTCSWESEPHIVNVSSDGSWSIPINTPQGSMEVHDISVEGRYIVNITNLLIGEVWICAGQSNMQMTLSSTTGGAEEAASANYPKIRLLNVTRKTSSTPVETIDAEWIPCMPSTAGSFSAAGYYFGKKIFSELNVPVGLIASNWGNTAIEVWMDASWVNSDAELSADIQTRSSAHTDGSPHLPGSAYNAMIYPLKNIPVAGVIWYQGENNQGSPYIYPKFLSRMVEGWREIWGKSIPFYISQIAPYQRAWNYRTNYSNPAMRFSQAEAAKVIPNSAVEVNDDIGDITDIHPKNKRDVGLRLAWLALSQHYGKSSYADYRCPVFNSAKIEGKVIVVKFDYADGGLKSADGLSPTMFEICGSDRVFYKADAVIKGNTVELTSPLVQTPVAARMGWSYTKTTNLRSSNGLPVSVFKTYSWSDDQEEI